MNRLLSALFPTRRSSSQSFWARFALGIGLFPLTVFAGAALSAERITLAYGPIERSIAVESLKTYAEAGTIETDLRAYTRYLDGEQLEQLRRILLVQADLDPVVISQFLYTDQGEVLLRRLGEVVRTESNLSGFYAIRSALIMAAADPEGLTVINVLRQFPLSSIRVNLDRTMRILGDLETLVRQTQDAITLVQQQSELEAKTESGVHAALLPDLRSPGTVPWQKRTIVLNDFKRSRSFLADVYLPQTPTPAPLIVISHGLGSDRTTYGYLAKQLASYGFAVAVPEHPGSNARQLQALISGAASQVTDAREFIDRPNDIKFVLDTLDYLAQTDPSFTGKFNLEQVGIVGQSLGGYTALALAGANINFQQLAADCTSDTLNLSLLLQCRALDLPPAALNFRDERVKAVIAINPVGSSLLGKADYQNIKIPVMIISGTADTVAPALLEQIRPFTWLTTPNKYLVMMQGGTHFSTIDVSKANTDGPVVELPSEFIGPSPRLAQTYLKAISVAFFSTYVAEQPSYRRYLESAYTQTISQSTLPINLVQSLTAAQLAKVFRDQPLQPSPEPNNSWVRTSALPH